MQFETMLGAYLAATVFLALAFGERIVDVLVSFGEPNPLTDWE